MPATAGSSPCQPGSSWWRAPFFLASSTFYRLVHDRKVLGTVPLVDLANHAWVPPDDRFLQAIVSSLVFCAALMILSVVLGIRAAVCFTGNFRGCGARTIFVLPMMPTSVTASLV